MSSSPESWERIKARMWKSRPRYPVEKEDGSIDFAAWHKETLKQNRYAMDIDKVEYRFVKDEVQIVGLYDLVKFSRPEPIELGPTIYPLYDGKRAVLVKLSKLLSNEVPVFVAWHRADLSEFFVVPIERLSRPSDGKRLSNEGFAMLLSDLPHFPEWTES
jgi:hypothetical protein